MMPDGQQFRLRFHSKTEAFAKFRLPAMDRLYERVSSLPDGPERLVPPGRPDLKPSLGALRRVVLFGSPAKLTVSA